MLGILGILIFAAATAFAWGLAFESALIWRSLKSGWDVGMEFLAA